MIEIFHHVKKYKDFYQIIFDEHIPMMYYYLLFDAVSSFMKESLDRYTMERVRNVEVNFLISYQTNAILGILIEWNREEYKTPIKELNEELIAILSMNSPFRQMN